MENVPVKIAENYKPPPRIYQLPQVVVTKLQLPTDYYHEAPQYQYDFQLERKVVAKIPEWRRMRQQEREARRERKEKREQQKLRAVEARQKQLLGAVSYPSAEDLSSTESEDDEELEQEPKNCDAELQYNNNNNNVLSVTANSNDNLQKPHNNFHNILQPTILSPAHFTNDKLPPAQSNTMHAGNVLSSAAAVAKPMNSVFNYKDFEEDTSSPFDNIELKTINDLDILRQVLHQTQLKAIEQKQQQADENNKQQKQAKDNEIDNEKNECNDNNAVVDLVAANNTLDKTKHDHFVYNTNAGTACTNNKVNLNANELQQELQGAAAAASLDIIEDTKAALEKINFNDINRELQQTNDSIPIPNINSYSNNYQHLNTNTYVSALTHTQQQQQQQQQNSYMPYANYNFHNTVGNIYSPQNNLFTINAGVTSTTTAASMNYMSPTHNVPSTAITTATVAEAAADSQIIAHSAHKNYMYINPNTQAKQYHHSPQYLNTLYTANSHIHEAPTATQQIHSNEKIELNSKSKSVPDILRELSDEVRNSEMRRRSRNLSYTIDDDKQHEGDGDNDDDGGEDKEKVKKNVFSRTTTTTQYYANLEVPAQKLAKNISSMGFPLELVAKIAQRVGVDDKKIFEHLIPLSELMDLGFDETKISEALIKFDNNKEKALDYLIS